MVTLQKAVEPEAYDELDRAIELAILEILDESHDPRTLAMILERVEGMQGEATAFAVREAIWRLVDREEIELTQDFNLSSAAV